MNKIKITKTQYEMLERFQNSRKKDSNESATNNPIFQLYDEDKQFNRGYFLTKYEAERYRKTYQKHNCGDSTILITDTIGKDNRGDLHELREMLFNMDLRMFTYEGQEEIEIPCFDIVEQATKYVYNFTNMLGENFTTTCDFIDNVEVLRDFVNISFDTDERNSVLPSLRRLTELCHEGFNFDITERLIDAINNVLTFVNSVDRNTYDYKGE